LRRTSFRNADQLEEAILRIVAAKVGNQRG
jgi:hypothetical protein